MDHDTNLRGRYAMSNLKSKTGLDKKRAVTPAQRLQGRYSRSGRQDRSSGMVVHADRRGIPAVLHRTYRRCGNALARWQTHVDQRGDGRPRIDGAALDRGNRGQAALPAGLAVRLVR